MKKIISVYFSGTAFSLKEENFLAASLHNRTEENSSQIKMGFNGCGVDYGFNGTIFGAGLDQQCQTVIKRLLTELKNGHQVILNVYGHSRGAIAALLLAKQLSDIDKNKLSIHLALLDPVPGNYITSSNLDPFKISLANKTMDLRNCKPLRKVLALYPHVPMPTIACHAPLLVSYPKETQVDEEVVNGCHAEAEQLSHPASKLVKLRIEEFLVLNGTQLRTDTNYHDAEAMKQTYLNLYRQELPRVKKERTRDVHSNRNEIIAATPGAKYLNNRHRGLAGGNVQDSVSLRIQTKTGFLSKCKQFFNHHPLLGQTLKWSLIALSTSSILYLTGFTAALAAIPLLSPTYLSPWSILICAPLIAGILAGLWYATKPLLSWCSNKFFYPHYEVAHIELPEVEYSNSTNKLIKNLGVLPAQANSSNPVQMPFHVKSPLHPPRKIINETLESVHSSTPLPSNFFIN